MAFISVDGLVVASLAPYLLRNVAENCEASVAHIPSEEIEAVSGSNQQGWKSRREEQQNSQCDYSH